MSGFIDWLEKLNAKDTKVRAVLRRSLAFTPGTFPGVYPYVEPFLKDEENYWRRQVYYLIAGIWAQHWRKRIGGDYLSIGKACANYKNLKDSDSIEQRFINLLDADSEQLPYRLRQIVSLLKDQNIDFEGLLKGLLSWNDDQKRTQNVWARDFYRTLNDENKQTEETD